MWLNLTATQGNKGAIKTRGDVTRIMTPADVFEAQRMAREWLEAHTLKQE